MVLLLDRAGRKKETTVIRLGSSRRSILGGLQAFPRHPREAATAQKAVTGSLEVLPTANTTFYPPTKISTQHPPSAPSNFAQESSLPTAASALGQAGPGKDSGASSQASRLLLMCQGLHSRHQKGRASHGLPLGSHNLPYPLPTSQPHRLHWAEKRSEGSKFGLEGHKQHCSQETNVEPQPVLKGKAAVTGESSREVPGGGHPAQGPSAQAVRT